MHYSSSILSFTCRYNNGFILKFGRLIINKLHVKNTHHCSNFHCDNLDTFNTKKSEYYVSRDLNVPDLSRLISIPESDAKLCVLVNEIQNVISKGRRYPEYLNAEQLRSLYSLETKTQRVEYLIYLFKKEKVKIADEQKKLEKKAKRENRKTGKMFNFECNSSPVYGIGKNTLLLSVRKKSMNRFYNCRLANSVLFGSKVVIDLDYEKYMVDKEKNSCINQLRYIFSTNRKDPNPFDLCFCNVNPNGKCIQSLKKDIPNVTDSLVTIFEGSYLDIFPKEHLVYLSPHADETLKIYDHNAVYIIGGYVDIVKKTAISSDKALAEGIKSFSLPLDEYIQWKQGSKSLTINQVFEIMLLLKNTGNWKKAFECLPSRKIHNISPDIPRTELLQNSALL